MSSRSALLVAVLFLAAACGGDGDSGDRTSGNGLAGGIRNPVQQPGANDDGVPHDPIPDQNAPDADGPDPNAFGGDGIEDAPGDGVPHDPVPDQNAPAPDEPDPNAFGGDGIEDDGPAPSEPRAEPDDPFVNPPLPVSRSLQTLDGEPHPEAFDYVREDPDCGFEAIYGPTATCHPVGTNGGDFALVTHRIDGGSGATDLYVTCGDRSFQTPHLLGAEPVEVGSFNSDGGDVEEFAGYVALDLGGGLRQIVVVALDAGIGDGCPIGYDVGEASADVILGGQRGALAIVDGDERSCVSRSGPGAYHLSDPAPAGTPCG